MTSSTIHARVDGPIVIIGFGSIGRGVLPLIERHIGHDKSRLVVIDPSDADRKLLDERGIKFIQQAVTRENYKTVLHPLLTAGGGKGSASISRLTHRPMTSWISAVQSMRSILTLSLSRGSVFTSINQKVRPRVQIMHCVNPFSICVVVLRVEQQRSPAAGPIRAWCHGL